MAQNTTVTLLPDTWTEFTNADTDIITFVNEGPGVVYVQATASAAPASKAGARAFPAGAGANSEALEDLFRGTVTTGRVWGISEVRNTVSVGQA